MTGSTETIDRLDTLGKHRAYPKGGTCKICGFGGLRANFRFSDVCGSHDCRVKAVVCDCRACKEKRTLEDNLHEIGCKTTTIETNMGKVVIIGDIDFCTCEDFKKAQEEGTDSEGYGAAIGHSIMSDNRDDLDVGSYRIPIKFCPWCGKKVSSD